VAARSGGCLCLAVETSCDETAAAVVREGRWVLADVVASQAELHRRFGGVVPEVAARRHLELVLPVVDEALRRAGVGWGDVEVVAVTRGPGLPAALLVGVAAAKALAWARGLPLVGVNHLAAHLYALRLEEPEAPSTPDGLPRPSVGLVVSGSHTDLCLLPEAGGLEVLGGTADDAAGEAFDKVARLLGLGYPGGPALERAAAHGDPQAFAFPRARPAGGPFGFSFSGLKTRVALEAEARAAAGDLGEGTVADIAASFQEAVVDVLVERTLAAAREHGVRDVLLCGGVAANRRLRARLGGALAAVGGRLWVPPLRFCTDNAAMVAAAGWVAYAAGRRDGWDLDADPDLPLAL
jgi:N6-L-threonylcarbamoyladenine synthase